MPRARRRFTSSGQPVARRLVVSRAGPVDARRARPQRRHHHLGHTGARPTRRLRDPSGPPREPTDRGAALSRFPRSAARAGWGSSPWGTACASGSSVLAVGSGRNDRTTGRASLTPDRRRSRFQGLRGSPPVGRGRSSPTRRTSPPPRPGPPSAASRCAAPSAARRPHPGSDRSLRGVPTPSTAGSAVANEAATHRGGRAARPHRATIGRAAPGGRRRTALRFEPLGAPAPLRRTDGMGRDRCPVTVRRSRLGAGLTRPLRRPRPGRALGASTPEPRTGHPMTRPQGPGRPAASPVARRPSDSPSANDSRRCSDAPSFNSARASGSRLSSPTNEPARHSASRSGDGPAARRGRPIPSGRGLTVAVHGEPAPARPRRGLAPRPVTSVAGESGGERTPMPSRPSVPRRFSRTIVPNESPRDAPWGRQKPAGVTCRNNPWVDGCTKTAP